MHRYVTATVMLLTLGGLGIWWLCDAFIIPSMVEEDFAEKVEAHNRQNGVTGVAMNGVTGPCTQCEHPVPGVVVYRSDQTTVPQYHHTTLNSQPVYPPVQAYHGVMQPAPAPMVPQSQPQGQKGDAASIYADTYSQNNCKGKAGYG
ncbi:hypothetical protein KIPB_010129 [Kipferlia bialata]|uniref:Uncharacterized protein n=1 Tax=Kipferlia bialata TaxID=797122 RepID=A0A9K3GMR9_9EUKA|nr:hypothetical protein KIPB_010129 [Kipferlia bialata]|eukprot:g10129.t1